MFLKLLIILFALELLSIDRALANNFCSNLFSQFESSVRVHPFSDGNLSINEGLNSINYVYRNPDSSRGALTAKNQFDEDSITAYGILQRIPNTQNKMSLNLELKLKFKDQSRVEGLTGKKFYQLIFEKFKGRFQAIKAEWVRELPDNLNEFNKFTSAPYFLSPEDAALETWSGKMAAQYGFTQVRIINIEGRLGRYTEVELYFVNPESMF